MKEVVCGKETNVNNEPGRNAAAAFQQDPSTIPAMDHTPAGGSSSPFSHEPCDIVSDGLLMQPGLGTVQGEQQQQQEQEQQEQPFLLPWSLRKVNQHVERMVTRRRFYTQDEMDDVHPLNLKAGAATLLALMKDKCRSSGSCVLNGLLGFLPILNVLRHYSWGSSLFMDLLCGISVGFLHLPQGLGFGLLAGLSPVHGLYTSLFPVLVYMVFGTSPHVSMGTNAVVALLSASIINVEADRFVAERQQQEEEGEGNLRNGGGGGGGGDGGGNQSVSVAELLEFKVMVGTSAAMCEGIILISMGLLRMGFLTNYMSNSFIGGFSFAAAVHITISQVVKLFHLELHFQSGWGKLVLTTVDVFRHFEETNVGDVVVGLFCGALLLAIGYGNKRYKHRLKVLVPGELVVVVVATLVSHMADLNGRFGVAVVGEVPQGMPTPSTPSLDVMSRIVFPHAVVDAVLIFVLTISLAKLTAKLHVINIDDNQELIAYGLCQVVGSFFKNFSSSISPPRTMMLSSMGARSTLNGLSTALFLLLVLLVAGPLFVSLPIAMLSVMIIVAMKDLLLQVGKVRGLWYVNKGDFIIWVVTVLFSVLGDLDLGLVAGTLCSVVMVLAYSQLAHGTLLGKAPNEDLYLDTRRRGIRPIPGVRIFRFESQLHFASAERFKSEIYRRVFDPTSVARKDHYEIDVTVGGGEPGNTLGTMRGFVTSSASSMALNSQSRLGASQRTLPSCGSGLGGRGGSSPGGGGGGLKKMFSGRARASFSCPDAGPKTPTITDNTMTNTNASALDLPAIELEVLSQSRNNQRSSKGDKEEEGGGGRRENEEEIRRENEEEPEEEEEERQERGEERGGEAAATGEQAEIIRYVILDCSTMTYIDLTGVEMLHLIITQFTRAGVAFLLTDLPPTTLRILQRANFFQHENYSRVYFNVMDAIHDIRTEHRDDDSFVKSFA